MTRYAATYTPLYLCEAPCRTTMHEAGIRAHLDYWHGPSNVACLRMLSADEHSEAGWDVSNYPDSIS